MTRDKLTGRTRHRVVKKMFKKPICVLQLEVSGVVTTGTGGMIDSHNSTWWIDTRPEHLTIKEDKVEAIPCHN